MLAPIHKVLWVKTIWKKTGTTISKHDRRDVLYVISLFCWFFVFFFFVTNKQHELIELNRKEKQFDFENENSADGAGSRPSAQRVLSNRLPASD